VRDLLHPLLWPRYLPDLQRAPNARNGNGGGVGHNDHNDDHNDGQEALIARHPAAAAVGRALEMDPDGHMRLVAPLTESDLALLRDGAANPNDDPNNRPNNNENHQINRNQDGAVLVGPVAANPVPAADRPPIADLNGNGLPPLPPPEGKNLWRGIVQAASQLVFFYAPLAVLLVWAPLVLGPFFVPGATPLNLGWVAGGSNGGNLGAEGEANGANSTAAAAAAAASAAEAAFRHQRQQAEVDAAMDVQLPLEQLLFHVLLPFALEKFRIRSIVKRTLQGWLLRAAVWLRVEHLVVAPQEVAQWAATQARAQQLWVNTRAAEEKDAAQHEALLALSAERGLRGGDGEAPWPSPEALAVANRLGEEAKRAVYTEERRRRLAVAMGLRQPSSSETVVRHQDQPAEAATADVAEGTADERIDDNARVAAMQQEQQEDHQGQEEKEGTLAAPTRDSMLTAAEKRMAAVNAAEARARTAAAAAAIDLPFGAVSTERFGLASAEDSTKQDTKSNSEFTAENVKFLATISHGKASEDASDQVESSSLDAGGDNSSGNDDDTPPELALFLAAAEVTHPNAVARALWRLGWSLTGLEFATVEDLEGVVVNLAGDSGGAGGGGTAAAATSEVRLSAAEAKRIVDCLPATLVAARRQARRAHWREAWARLLVLAMASIAAAVLAVRRV